MARGRRARQPTFTRFTPLRSAIRERPPFERNHPKTVVSAKQAQCRGDTRRQAAGRPQRLARLDAETIFPPDGPAPAPSPPRAHDCPGIEPGPIVSGDRPPPPAAGVAPTADGELPPRGQFANHIVAPLQIKNLRGHPEIFCHLQVASSGLSLIGRQRPPCPLPACVVLGQAVTAPAGP